MRQVGMQVTAKAEYALRAATVLATSGPGPMKSEAIAAGGGPEPDTAAPAVRRTNDALRAVWSVLRANERAVLESVTLADLASGRLPQMTTLARVTGA